MSNTTTPDLSNPFPGLRCFQSDEDYLFFGRHAQIEDLLRRLRTNRLVAVVGTSGSGKSSLVRAGLLPAVLGGGMSQAGSAWEIAVMRPGGSPLIQLAKSLCDAGFYNSDDEDVLPHLLATLSRSRNGLIQAVRQSRAAADSKLLLVVDQFEELFRFNRASAESQEESIQFVNLLLQATQEAENVYVVLTMRSDFLGECSQFLGLAEAVNDGEFLIPRMTRDQIQEAIEGPIRVQGAEIAPRLLFRLLNDVEDDQDQLPVLQHALMRTWALRSRALTPPSGSSRHEGMLPNSVVRGGDGRVPVLPAGNTGRGDEAVPAPLAEDGIEQHTLTSAAAAGPLDLEHYEATGGMHHALSRHADEIFEALPSEEHRTAATRLFKALTERGPDGRGIRRPARLGTLAAIVGLDEAIVRLVIEAYRAPGVTFLMPPVASPLDDSSVIDISHESLMRTWTRLRLWVEEEAQSARIYRRLLETAALHSEKRAGLYHDPDLQVALSWRDESKPNAAWSEQYGGGFEGAMAFLDQSREVAEREEKEREAARQRELERAQQFAATQAKVARIFKRFAGSLAIGLCLAVALTLWAFKLRQEAQAQRKIAQRTAYDASISSIQADWEKRNYRRVRETLASQADYAEPSFEWFYWQRMTHLESSWFGTYAEGIRTYSVTADGKKIVMVMQDWSIEVRTLPAGELRARIPVPQRTHIDSAVFSPDGRSVVSCGSGSSGGEVKLWNAETGGEIRSFGEFVDLDPVDPKAEPLPSQTVDGHQRAVAFSPDGRFLITGGAPEIGVQLWEVTTGKKLRVFEETRGSWIQHLAFCHDGKRVLCERQASLVLFDAETGEQLDALREEGVSFALAPDSRRVATVRNGKITIYDLTAGDFSKGLEVSEQPGAGRVLAFSPDGKRLVASDEGGRWSSGGGDSVIYDSFTGEKQLTLRGGSFASQFLGDSQHIVSTDGDRRIKIWDASADQELVRVKTGYIPIALARDGSRMVVALPNEATSRGGGWPDEDRHSGRLAVLDTATGQQITQMLEHEGGLIDGAAFSPDLNWVASGGRDDGGMFRVWNAATGKVKLKVETPRAEHYEIGFGPKGDTIISRTEQPMRGHAIWDIESGDEILSPKTPIDERDWAITRDGLHLASCDGRGFVRVWDTHTGNELRKWKAHSDQDHDAAMMVHNNECMDYSADGKHLVTGGLDRLIKLWNPDTGQLERVFSGHLGFVVGVHFTPDQRRLISQSLDRTVRIWDLATGKQLLSLTDPLFNGVWTWCVGVSRDGRRVVSAPLRQREIVIWEAATPEQVAAWRQHEEADATLWAAEQAKL